MRQYGYLLLVVFIALVLAVWDARGDEGTRRHVVAGFATTYFCAWFLEEAMQLKKPEAWKSWIICAGGLFAASMAMEGAQAQERGQPIDMGDVGNNMIGGAGALGLRAVVLEF